MAWEAASLSRSSGTLDNIEEDTTSAGSPMRQQSIAGGRFPP